MSPTPGGIYVCSSVLVVAASLVVLLRLGVRLRKKIRLGLDDFFIVVSLLLIWAFFVVLIVGTDRGTMGTHTTQDPSTSLVILTWHEQDMAKLEYISQLLAILCFGAIKISVLFLFRRIFMGRKFDFISKATIAVVALWTVAFFFAQLFQCGGKPGWFWNSSTTVAEHCGRYKQIMLGFSISDVVLYIIVLAIPVPILWNLYTTLSQSFLIMAVFLIGGLAMAISVTKLVCTAEEIYETTLGARDVRGVGTKYMVWNYAEAGVGAVAASLPTLRPLFDAPPLERFVDDVCARIWLYSNNSKSRTQKRFHSHSTGTYCEADDVVEIGEAYRKSRHTSYVEHTKPNQISSRPHQLGILVSREFRVDEAVE